MGKRIPEDNWRRGTKTAIFLDDNEEPTLSFLNSELFDDLSKSLPCDDQNKLKSMNDSIMISLFNLGLIHHYETKNLQLSEKYFKRIIENYQPETQSIASIYELHNIYQDLERAKESNEMKELLSKKISKKKIFKTFIWRRKFNTNKKAKKKEQKFICHLFLLIYNPILRKVLETCSHKTQRLDQSSDLSIWLIKSLLFKEAQRYCK